MLQLPPKKSLSSATITLRSRSRSRTRVALSRFLHSKLNIVALLILTTITISCFGAYFVTTNVLHQNRDSFDYTLLNQGFQPPVGPGVNGHLLGTDDLARDTATRLLYGGQVSLSVGFLTALISVFIGTTLGLLSGYFRGWVDDLINIVIQIISNLPTIFLLIILSFLINFDVLSLSVFIALLSWVGTARLVRGQVLSLRSLDYVDAARVVGASNLRILSVHILPNVASLVLVAAGFDVVGAMLTEAGLSYLNFGLSIPIPSWGNLLSNSTNYFLNAPWLVYPPALALLVTLLSVNLVVNGLRDAFDVRVIN